MFTRAFPVISETFIVHQITGLLELGHQTDIFAETRVEQAEIQPDIAKYRLLDRTTFLDLPPEASPWELPAWPLTGRTWIPGASEPMSNLGRLCRALPLLVRCLRAAPRLARQVLSRGAYGYQAASLSALHRLAALCRAPRRCDLAHAHFGPAGNSFRFVRDLWHVPYLVTFYGYDFGAVPRKQGPDVYTQLFKSADRVIVISEHARCQVEKLGCPPARLLKIPLGLRVEDFPFRPRTLDPGGPVRILTIGRLVEKKGVEYSLRAFAKLHSAQPQLRYDIIGDGPRRAALTQLAAELGIADQVSFHGARTADYVREQLAQAHLFMLASVTAADGDQEGQGLVIQEAQACGLPVVISNHAALPEGIDVGRSGLVVPERDSEALAAALADLISRPESWPEMGRAGRRFVEAQFELGHVSRQLAAVYEEACRHKR